jgi:hypothetical protein
LSTTVRLIAAPELSNGCKVPIHNWSWFTRRFTASWLNQVEMYFSIVQRKVLTANDFPSLDALAERLLDFQYYWEAAAKPFEWRFSRQDLNDLLNKLNAFSAKVG